VRQIEKAFIFAPQILPINTWFTIHKLIEYQFIDKILTSERFFKPKGS